MKLATPYQMNDIDAYAVNMGIPSIILMENAANAVVNELPDHADSFLVLCGKGNNGGDGYAVARLLHTSGKRVTVVNMETPVKGDALTNYQLANSIGIEFIDLKLADTSRFDIIIDAMLGTGINSEVKGDYVLGVDLVNFSDKTVVAIDVPSGIDAYSGQVMGCCVRADTTVTFGLPKVGLIGNEYVGRMVVAPISIPKEAIEAQGIRVNLTESELVKNILPKRCADSHKGTYGKVFAVAGSIGMTGAARLCTEAALRTGAGLVWLGLPRSLNDIMEQAVVEAMTIPLPDNNGVLSNDAVADVLGNMSKTDVLLFGCGLTASNSVEYILREILNNLSIPAVIDADGINVLARDLSVLKGKEDIVLTPHVVEFSRLSGLSIEEIQNDRTGSAMGFAMEHRMVVVLKGPGTVIASPEGECYVNPTGNPGMATGGAGDVLAGIIASLIGQGVPPYKAAVAGVYIHGLCGDMAAQELGMHGMLATDILRYIPLAINRIV